MKITQERAELLCKYLMENEERAEVMYQCSAEEAAERINADGYDLTAAELADLAEEVEKLQARKNGELNEDDLDTVAGGGLGRWALESQVYWYLLGVKVAKWIIDQRRRQQPRTR